MLLCNESNCIQKFWISSFSGDFFQFLILITKNNTKNKKKFEFFLAFRRKEGKTLVLDFFVWKFKIIMLIILFSSLRISPRFHYEAPWPSAQAEIRRLAAYKTPQDKVNCVVRCSQTIMNLLSMATKPGQFSICRLKILCPAFGNKL